MSLERLDHIIAGALFDFGGFLTTREKVLTISATHDSAPMVEALTEFLNSRNIEDCTPFMQWELRCSGGEVPTKIATALEIISSAMRDDPHYAWTWHCNLAMAYFDEGIVGPLIANKAAARFMKLAFGVDTSEEPRG